MEGLAALASVWATINSLGLPGVFLVIALTGWRRYWVFGWLYDDMRKDRDEWKALAQRHESDGERAASFILDQAARMSDRQR